MKKQTALLVVFLGLNAFGQTKIDTTRCAPERAGEATVYSTDFKWGMSRDEIRSAATSMYNSEKRLAQRAFYDENTKTMIFPHIESQGGNVKIPAQFIKTIQRHVEKAFERGYVDALMFPDMGHSHFLIPNALYKKELEPLPVNKFNVLYEKIMQMKEVKVVYHTAEQLKVTDENKKLSEDQKLQWRYYTRNLVGHNTAEPDIELVNATAQSAANTMSESDAPGYHWWGGGFNIHANKNGCFAFKKGNKTLYFDLSLYDIVPEPGKGGLDD